MTKFQIQWKGQGDLSTLHKSRHSLGKILTGSISKIKPDDKKQCKHTTAKEKEEEEMQEKKGEKRAGREKESRVPCGILWCILNRRSHGGTLAEFSHSSLFLGSCPTSEQDSLVIQHPSDQFFFC